MTGSLWLEVLKPFFEITVLLSLSALLLKTALVGAQIRGWSFRKLHRFARQVILASVVLPLAMLAVPRSTLLRPAAQIWDGIPRRHQAAYTLIQIAPSRDASPAPRGLKIPKGQMEILALLLLAGSVLRLLWLVRELARLRTRLENLPLLKKSGTVRILVSSSASSPFSCWMPRRTWIVLPTHSFDLLHTQDLKTAIQHEIQHHRHGDTRWVYVLEALKVIFFWNPMIFWLARIMSQIQEFACDEFLIGHRKISPQAYGNCLLRAAQTAIQSRLHPVGTAGMARELSGFTLKRRVEMLFRKPTSQNSWLAFVASVGTLALFTSLAYGSRSAIQDRKLTLSEARELAQKASQGTEIPIHVNELVLERLNRFVGTPEGRKFVREGLARLPNYKEMIDRKTREHGLPEELIAVALFESGFDNEARNSISAGIWQFISKTARKYQLVVNPSLDERLNPEKETEAAMRYFSDLFRMFGDWRLALKSYNEGESHVQKLIEQFGTRDAWELERLSSTEGYLAGATAMLIIYKNPSLLN